MEARYRFEWCRACFFMLHYMECEKPQVRYRVRFQKSTDTHHREEAEMREFIGRGLGVLFAILLIFIVFVTSFEYVCYHRPGIYRAEIEKYQVQEELLYWRNERIEVEALEHVFLQTMSYLRGHRENLIVETDINGVPAEFYNETEKSHMADVRVLFTRSLVFRALAILSEIAILGYLIISVGVKRAVCFLAEEFLRVSVTLIAIVILIAVLVMTDFTKYFTIFHEIFFRQGNWMFDPQESRMIDIMPEALFSDFALWITETFLGVLAGLLVASIGIVKVLKSQKTGKK